MRNWSNSETDLTLEEAADAYEGDYVQLIGMDIESVDGDYEQHTLALRSDPIGIPPRIGEIIQCSALGAARHWRVRRVAVGYPASRVSGRPHTIKIASTNAERDALICA